MTRPPSPSSTPEPPALAWQATPQALEAGPLRLAVQRIGLDHWRPEPPLRSWGVAPLLAEPGQLLVPCFDAEALWLGAWLEAGGTTAVLLLSDPASGAAGLMELPAQDQLVALRRADAAPAPIVRGTAARHPLALLLQVGTATTRLDLLLLAPAQWQARAGREAPPPRLTPPPLPPRLG